MSTKLETETFAGKTIQAYKDQAAKAGIVIRAPIDLDSGDFPAQIYGNLIRFRRNLNLHRKKLNKD